VLCLQAGELVGVIDRKVRAEEEIQGNRTTPETLGRLPQEERRKRPGVQPLVMPVLVKSNALRLARAHDVPGPHLAHHVVLGFQDCENGFDGQGRAAAGECVVRRGRIRDDEHYQHNG